MAFKALKESLMNLPTLQFSPVQFSSVAQSCLTLCNSMDCSMPGFPVHHQLLELVQPHVHWVGDAIQPSHPLSPPSLPAFNLSQHQGLFQWVSSYIMWPKYSCFFLPLGLTGLISLLSKGLWRGFCSITIQKHQFFVIQHSLWSNSPILTWRLEKP